MQPAVTTMENLHSAPLQAVSVHILIHSTDLHLLLLLYTITLQLVLILLVRDANGMNFLLLRL